MDLQTFFESTLGKGTIIIAIVLVLAIGIMSTDKKQKINTRAFTFSAIAVSIAFVLNQITLLRMPQGGSITPCSMLVICLVGYWFGPKTGICAGISMGMLDMLINPYIITPLQALLDYPLAYGMLGLSGFFRNDENYIGLIKGYILSVFGRFFCSFMSAVIFFGEYAPEGFNAVTWGIVYNGTFMGVEAIITIAVLAIPAVKTAIMKIKRDLDSNASYKVSSNH